METNQILSADVLDIIFDQRNKEYGAYDLRKNYQRRMVKALSISFSLMALSCVTYVVMGSIKHDDGKLLAGPDVILAAAPPPPDKPVPPPPPPPPPPPVPPVKMVDFTPPVIVKGEVPPEEMPPIVDDIVNAKIGTVNTDGANDNDVVGPPVAESKGVVEAPKKQDDAEVIFTKVEIESQYPGGAAAWGVFLGRNMPYPPEAADAGIEGTVFIQFIVDTEGNVSNVEAVSGPDELRKAAVAAVKKSGRWEPAIQNGKKVKSYKRQPITFKLDA